MDRQEHLEWCKERARVYLDQDNVPEAITSMLSDLVKHEDTAGAANALTPLALAELMNPNVESARKFIEGFN